MGKPVTAVQAPSLSRPSVAVKPRSLSLSRAVSEAAQARARKDLKEWLGQVGLPYHSPHKFRHGNAVYSLKWAKDILALKAVSQNLMHANLSVTDGVYGVLSEVDVRKQIQSLDKRVGLGRSENAETLITLLEELISDLKKEREAKS